MGPTGRGGAGAAGVRRLAKLSALLIGVDYLDEFAGAGFVGAPDIQGEFAISYTAAALILFVIPGLLGVAIEPIFYMLSDRWPRKPLVVGGLLTLGVLQIAAGFATSAWWLGAALALTGAASGVGVNVAQATLVDATPDDRERAMARWTFAGVLGDFSTPALFWVLAALSLGWHEAFFATGGLIVAYALLLATREFPPARNDGDATLPSIREALRGAFANRQLLLWLFAVLLCSLLDEILVTFGGLHLRVNLGADTAERSLVLMAFVAGAGFGLLAVERALARVPARRILLAAGAAGTLGYAVWLALPVLWMSGLAMFVVGFVTAPLYPIAMAQAYRALPDQSGMVNALSSMFAPFDLALPLALGAVADSFGLYAALLLLAGQPIGILLIAASQREAPNTAQ